MPSLIPDAAYVHRFNAHLAELNWPALVALTRLDAHSCMLELTPKRRISSTSFPETHLRTWPQLRSDYTPTVIVWVSAAAKKLPLQAAAYHRCR